jgi:hypothetical protein
LNLIEQHKAAIITVLLTGIVVFGMFSIHITQQKEFLSESYYLLEPEPEKTKEELLKTEDLLAASTNKAFNEDQEYKDMMRNFKSIDANDFERTTKKIADTKTSEVQQEISINKSNSHSDAYAINSKETESYNKLQDELNKRLENKRIAEEHAKAKSTLTYSLKGRTLINSSSPRYLCESGGKIVVSISVNEKGDVFDAAINGSSNSNNQCLVNHAIEYARSVQFNASKRTDQIGTITFMFKGKY